MQSFEDALIFTADMDTTVIMRNFWPPEDGFIWSSGKWCEIIFSFAVGGRQPTARADLIIDMDVFSRPGELEAQDVLLYLNGLRIGSYHVQRRTTYFAMFDTHVLRTHPQRS